MTTTMTIVKANMRPDILLIYKEVESQLKRNAWKVDEYIPTSNYLWRTNSSKTFLLKSALRSLTLRATLKACREWRFFFEGGRARVGRLLDFLSFSKHLDSHPSAAVFILNQRHSSGACHAARLRDIPIITHQHGDYYNDRVPLTQPLRDVEGPDTIRIVWNEDSRNIIQKLSPRGTFRVGGSLKHAAIQRESQPSAREPGIVFFETTFLDKDKDRSVTEFNASFLGALQRELACPMYVAAHPLRTSGPTPSEDPLHPYYEAGVRKWPYSRAQVEWAICSDSNALFDVVFTGIPCLHLKREDSYLSIPDSYPGTIRAEGDFVARAMEAIACSDPTSLAKAQLVFLQDHMIGSLATVDRCFSELLAELATGQVTQGA